MKTATNGNGHELESRTAMFAEERQRTILELLRAQGKVTVEELTNTFRVSPPTIRTDLTRLEEQGLLRRTHGGAIAVGNTLYEPPYSERAVIRHAEKRAIARATGEMVHEGETLMLDAGTTCHEVALVLKEFRHLTIVTNSLVSAQALAENDGIHTILIGGLVQQKRHAALGPLATQFLDGIQCDRAIVAMSGVHAKAGFTVIDFDAAQVKRKMLEKAKQTIAVADSSKVGQIAFACVAPLTAVTLFLTDQGIPVDDRATLEEAGLRVAVAK